MFDILSRKLDHTLIEQYDDMRDVFRVSFELLIAMAKDNSAVSQRLFERLDDMLKVDGAVDELAELYAQVTGQKIWPDRRVTVFVVGLSWKQAPMPEDATVSDRRSGHPSGTDPESSPGPIPLLSGSGRRPPFET